MDGGSVTGEEEVLLERARILQPISELVASINNRRLNVGEHFLQNID